jgi:hypothetical protein
LKLERNRFCQRILQLIMLAVVKAKPDIEKALKAMVKRVDESPSRKQIPPPVLHPTQLPGTCQTVGQSLLQSSKTISSQVWIDKDELRI